MVKAKENTVAKPDRLNVISPIAEDGSYQFWDKVRTGKMPREGSVEDDGFKLSLTFKIDDGYYALKHKCEERLGSLSWDQFNKAKMTELRKNIFLAMPKVFKKYGFTGTCTAIGKARRGNKKGWDFYLTGANFKFNENFILAKLMDKDVFEKLIWDKAVRMTYPNRRFKQAA